MVTIVQDCSHASKQKQPDCYGFSRNFGASVKTKLARDAPVGENAEAMKKASNKPARKQMRKEYDFSQGERGRYARRYAQGTNVVVLAPDVATVFPAQKAVNISLRQIIRQQARELMK
jgi:hypothetical protein